MRHLFGFADKRKLSQKDGYGFFLGCQQALKPCFNDVVCLGQITSAEK